VSEPTITAQEAPAEVDSTAEPAPVRTGEGAPAQAASSDSDRAEFEAWKAQRDAEKAAADSASNPEYYVWLASGDVVRLHAEELVSAGSHYDGVAIVNSYPVGG